MKIISHFLSLYHFFIIIILTLKTCISFLRRLYKVKVKTNIIQERNVALYLITREGLVRRFSRHFLSLGTLVLFRV